MSHRFRQITPTDHFGWHAAYLDVYEKLFAPFKALDGDEFQMTIRLLEIGTDGGGGLRMYHDYFPQGAIIGYDIASTPDAAKGIERIAHFQRDAYTAESVKMAGDLDIAIDDGPHSLGSQEFFVANYPHCLTENGIAIVEDIQDPAHIQHLAARVPGGFFAMGIDLRHVNGRYDDLLLAVWRR